MKKKLIGLTLLLVIAAMPAAVYAEVYNFLQQGCGFFYEPELFGVVGDFDRIQNQNPPFTFDFGAYEVTWGALDLAIVNYEVIGPMLHWEFEGGTIGVYQDGGFDFDYGAGPNDGIATATNGEAVLLGSVDHAQMFFNTMTLTGTFEGYFMFTGGTRFGELGNLGNQEWVIFDGVSAEEIVNVPPGYHSRFDGRLYVNLITPAESTSWSELRSLY